MRELALEEVFGRPNLTRGDNELIGREGIGR